MSNSAGRAISTIHWYTIGPFERLYNRAANSIFASSSSGRMQKLPGTPADRLEKLRLQQEELLTSSTEMMSSEERPSSKYGSA